MWEVGDGGGGRAYREAALARSITWSLGISIHATLNPPCIRGYFGMAPMSLQIVVHVSPDRHGQPWGAGGVCFLYPVGIDHASVCRLYSCGQGDILA